MAKLTKREKDRQTALRMAIDQFIKEAGIDDKYVPMFHEEVANAIAVAARKECEVKDKDGVVTCEIDPDTFAINISWNKLVVEEVENPSREIELAEAKKYKRSARIGDTVSIPVELDSLGRVAAQTVKHTIRQGVRKIEKIQVAEVFNDKIGEMVSAVVVKKTQSGDVIVKSYNKELLLPLKEQNKDEKLEAGDTIKIYIKDVREEENDIKVLISRIDDNLVKRLFEEEVTEIQDGLVEIRAIAREVGSRTKIAVYSADENVDPIGACIGVRGDRINRIISQLSGEKIDIVKHSDDPKEYISAALAPAKILGVEILDADMRSCRVTVPEDQLSLAIGNKGQNARLAARLTKWKIDIIALDGQFESMIQL